MDGGGGGSNDGGGVVEAAVAVLSLMLVVGWCGGVDRWVDGWLVCLFFAYVF